MELTDILALVKAGYTRNEIEQMQVPPDTNAVPNSEPVKTDVPETKPTEQTAQVAEPVAAAVPNIVPTQAQTPVQDQPTMADLMQSMAKLTSAIQANAIAQSTMPGVQNTPTAEDMLAEIIRPTFQKKE